MDVAEEVKDSVDPATEAEDVCGDGGVMKEIIREGEGWETPADGVECKVHYVGTLLDGTPFDSSRDRGTPFDFTVGSGVIKGWSECAKTMKKGELCKVTLSPEYAYGASGSAPKIPPNATLVFEIELLSFKVKETDITKKKDGGIVKRGISEGKKSWVHPGYESSCTYHLKIYHGSQVFLDTQASGPRTTEIGDESAYKFVEKALKNLSKKEKAHFLVKAPYAFGPAGNPELNIPPNTDLDVEMELLSFVKAKEDWGLSFEEKIAASIKRKGEGNVLFQNGQYRAASKKYKRSLKTFEHEKEKDLEADKKKTLQNDVRLPCHLNLAACQLKLNKPAKAKTQAVKALEIDSRNVKALWRHGLALQDLGDWDAAKKCYDDALAIEPDNKTIMASLKKLRATMTAYDKKQQSLYKNLFA